MSKVKAVSVEVSKHDAENPVPSSKMKKIGEVSFYLDTTGGTMPSRTDNFQGENRIILAPDVDSKILGHTMTINDGLTIVAHEIGHYLCRLFRIPSHNPLLAQAGVRLPAEQDAWYLAEKVNPDLDKKIRDSALKGYMLGESPLAGLLPPVPTLEHHWARLYKAEPPTSGEWWDGLTIRERGWYALLLGLQPCQTRPWTELSLWEQASVQQFHGLGSGPSHCWTMTTDELYGELLPIKDQLGYSEAISRLFCEPSEKDLNRWEDDGGYCWALPEPDEDTDEPEEPLLIRRAGLRLTVELMVIAVIAAITGWAELQSFVEVLR